jgi:drug/metabolite transporter superfamily protein YnfA
MNAQLLLAGLLCALALNASTAWIHWARAPREARGSRHATTWGALSAVLQTLPLPLVFVIVLLEPTAFNRLLERTPYGTVLAALGLCLVVVALLWRLFVELTYTIPAMRREHAEAALGRRVLSIARRQRLLPSSLASDTPARSAGPGRVLVVSDSVSDLLDEESGESADN